jgi:hypothetical protein
MQVMMVDQRSLLKKCSFVPVGNPHLYWVSNRYKPSDTNDVKPGTNGPSPSDVAEGHLYRVEAPPDTNMRFLLFYASLL